jgi:hypothetical protein
VRISHADPASDTFIIDIRAGVDAVTRDPVLAGLILVSVL